MTDALTAVFLLNGNSFTSVIGQSLLLRFAKLFVTFNEVTMTLGSSVRKLVPLLQAMCSPSLTDTNLKAVVQNVMALSLKPRANLDWIVKTITDVSVAARAVNNHNCRGVLTQLTSAVVPNRVLSIRKKNPAALGVVELKATKVKDNKVCFVIVGLFANTCVGFRV